MEFKLHTGACEDGSVNSNDDVFDLNFKFSSSISWLEG